MDRCDSQRKPPAEDEDFGPSWIPMGLKVVRNPDGTVDVSEISDEVSSFFLYMTFAKQHGPRAGLIQ